VYVGGMQATLNTKFNQGKVSRISFSITHRIQNIQS
jgi:hypothetical protein